MSNILFCGYRNECKTGPLQAHNHSEGVYKVNDGDTARDTCRWVDDDVFGRVLRCDRGDEDLIIIDPVDYGAPPTAAACSLPCTPVRWRCMHAWRKGVLRRLCCWLCCSGHGALLHQHVVPRERQRHGRRPVRVRLLALRQRHARQLRRGGRLRPQPGPPAPKQDPHRRGASAGRPHPPQVTRMQQSVSSCALRPPAAATAHLGLA